ncbi:MAG: glycosyltransferase family 1 protein, partial [Pseudomonadota bacterium]
KINLIIGATSLVQPLTGIGQYTLNLAQELSLHSNLNIDYFNGFSWTKNPDVRDFSKSGKLKKLIRSFVPNAYEFRKYAQQKTFDLKANKIKADIYHEPNFLPLEFDGLTVITVHDLSYIRHPEAHPLERIRVMNKLLPPAIEHSNCIIADSHFTKSEILSEFNIDSNKVHVTHLGKSSDFYPRNKIESQEILQKYNLTYGNFILAVGTLEPRKNLTQVISAYRLLPSKIAKQFPLVIVGVRGWKEKGLLGELEFLLKEKKAYLLGYVPANDLPHLYSAARAFVFPSLYEGFGLPPLEAMACGTPVITSNTSSIPEVVEEAGLMVSIGDVDAMKNYIEMICEDNVMHTKLSIAGLNQSEKFSWVECAKQTFNAYQYALDGK